MNNLLPNDVDSLLDRQKAGWLAGERPRVADLLGSFPANAEVYLDLLYNEIVLREELGESPSLGDYRRDYPHLADDLGLHFEVHAALHANLLNDTRDLQGEVSVPDHDFTAIQVGPPLLDYEIIAPLGQGGMGIVYKARHRRLQRLVAVKMFKPGRQPSPRELVRFQTEAEAIARLQHPNIVQIFEVGRSEGLPFLALELAEGGTLAHKLQRLPFTPKAAAALVLTLAQAVQHAHEQGIVHRDLKPANVLFTSDGTTKITDFGLAKMLEDPTDSPRDATRTGEPLGTPRYMAPEQAAGQADRIGPATDVYALGTLLYECLTGQVPFVAASAVETMERIRDEEPVSPRRLQRSIPRDLGTICLKCLHKQSTRRYASARELADDLTRFLQGEPIQARPTPVWERAWMWCRRRPVRAVLAATVFLALSSGAVLFGVLQLQERQRLNQVRTDVASLVREGQEALAQQDNRTAQERFLRALTLVRAEPSLSDHELGVWGWLDHSRRQAEQEGWQQRRPPPLFEELRDDALMQCLLLDARQPLSIPAAREAIRAALGLTLAGDPAWNLERELLTLLDADLSLREGNAAAALSILDRSSGVESRLWQQRRAACLDQLGRKAEAEQARLRAAKLAPKDTLTFFLSGLDKLQRDDAGGAIHDFDSVLRREPGHFMARLFQAACFLRERRLGEAKVGLTACLAQRPRFAWTHLLRGQVHWKQNDFPAALEDMQRGLESNPSEAARFTLLVNRGLLHLEGARWDLATLDFAQALVLRAAATLSRRR